MIHALLSEILVTIGKIAGKLFRTRQLLNSPLGVTGRGCLTNSVQYRDYCRDLIRIEYTFHSSRTEIDEGRAIKQARVHESPLRQVVDDEINELDLIGRGRFADQKLVKSRLR